MTERGATTGTRGFAAERGGLGPLLTADRVVIPVQGGHKDAVLRELVDALVRSLGNESEGQAIYRAVRQREEVLSTGIGHGVAIPHAKYDGLDDIAMAAGVSDTAIAFDALDGRPVRLVFLLVSPTDQAARQVRTLSRLGRILRSEDRRQRLIGAAGAAEFLRELEAADRGI